MLGRIIKRLVLIGAIVWGGYTYLSTKFGGHGLHHASERSASVSSDDAAQDGIPNDPAFDAEAPSATNGAGHHKRSRHTDAVDSVGTPPAAAEQPLHSHEGSSTATAATLAADPNSNARVADAMTEAETGGQPVRWHADHLHGYAVPSSPDANGCRMVLVSIDETGDKSSAVKLCPST